MFIMVLLLLIYILIFVVGQFGHFVQVSGMGTRLKNIMGGQDLAHVMGLSWTSLSDLLDALVDSLSDRSHGFGELLALVLVAQLMLDERDRVGVKEEILSVLLAPRLFACELLFNLLFFTLEHVLFGLKPLLITFNLIEFSMDSLDLVGKISLHFLLLLELLGQISNVISHGVKLHANDGNSANKDHDHQSLRLPQVTYELLKICLLSPVLLLTVGDIESVHCGFD